MIKVNKYSLNQRGKINLSRPAGSKVKKEVQKEGLRIFRIKFCFLHHK